MPAPRVMVSPACRARIEELHKRGLTAPAIAEQVGLTAGRVTYEVVRLQRAGVLERRQRNYRFV